MKHVILVLLCMASIVCRGQKMPDDYFEEGVAAAERKQYPEAIADFTYIMNKHPKNRNTPYSVYNIATLYFDQKNYDSAKKYYYKILGANYNDYDERGGGIMDDPYTNYKHWASLSLSDIYKYLKMYDSSLYYLALSDSVHKYLHFCGNELAGNRIHTAMCYADLYELMGKPIDAEKSLLPESFSNSLASNKKLLDQLIALFKKNNDVMALKKELDKSVNSFTIDTSYYDKDTPYSCVVLFMGTKITTDYYYYTRRVWTDNRTSWTKNDIIKYLKSSEFYVRVNKL